MTLFIYFSTVTATEGKGKYFLRTGYEGPEQKKTITLVFFPLGVKRR
jgi:hypothetical protein